MKLSEMLLIGTLGLAGCHLSYPAPNFVHNPSRVEVFICPVHHECSYSPQFLEFLDDYYGSHKLDLWCVATDDNFEKDKLFCRRKYDQTGIGGVNKLLSYRHDTLPAIFVDGELISKKSLCRMLTGNEYCLKKD